MRLKPSVVLRMDNEHVLLLKGLLLLVVIAFAFLVAWHYGLLQRVWREDPTGLSTAITAIFLLAAGHGGSQFVRLSQALNQLETVQRWVDARDLAPGGQGVGALPEGCVGAYIEKLFRKARFGGPRPIDQTLLLESFESELRRGHNFGWFVADLLLSLGLLGTVVGFILMLSPISGLESDDHGAVRHALAAMSDGMAVALYTTLTGLVGGVLLKIQGMFLDNAVEDLVRRVTVVTEVDVLPAIERMRSHAPA
jgi:hypothetical protein